MEQELLNYLKVNLSSIGYTGTEIDQLVTYMTQCRTYGTTLDNLISTTCPNTRIQDMYTSNLDIINILIDTK